MDRENLQRGNSKMSHYFRPSSTIIKNDKNILNLREDEVSHGKVLTPQDVPVQAKLAYPYNNFIATKTKKKYSASYPRNLIDFELL